MERKKAYIYMAVIVLVIGGYFAYTIYQKKQLDDFAMEKQVSDFGNTIPAQCENGEWIEFPDYGKKGNFSEYIGNINLKGTSDSEDNFTNQDGSISFVTAENYSLASLENLDVRIEGMEIGTPDKRVVYVKKIKCVGKEANPDIRTQRQNLMRYLVANIDSLAIEKSHGKPWQIQTFYFVNDTDLYVEYESPGSIGGDSPYDAKLWLIRVANLDTSVPAIETLGYIEEDEDDSEQNRVITGQDLYKDNDNMTVYEFDDVKKSWVMQ